jgi:hypothetical protein
MSAVHRVLTVFPDFLHFPSLPKFPSSPEFLTLLDIPCFLGSPTLPAETRSRLLRLGTSGIAGVLAVGSLAMTADVAGVAR